ncbi:MAG: hypothetical protein MJ099_06465, partial [Clostridia bacterium]|nr:hypothetical protein [Clostridia bacterium]
SFDNTLVWVIGGTLVLLIALYLLFRQGMQMGHESCSMTSTIESVTASGNAEKLEPVVFKKAWNKNNAIRLVLASGLVSYVINCFYIIMMQVHAGETLLLGSRLVSWLVSLPYWPILVYWHDNFTVLTPDIIVLLMVTPFILPAVTAIGYLQGPRLWAHSETAMKAGRRRAKARSRVMKTAKRQPKGPEI